jgi:hypothetical protein
MKFLPVFIIVTFASVAFSQIIPRIPLQIIKICPNCNFSSRWPYGSSTGITGNCQCLKKGGGIYRLFLDGKPQKSCCSNTKCPRCPNYSATSCTCAPPLALLHPWIVNNGYCCDIIVGLGGMQQEGGMQQAQEVGFGGTQQAQESEINQKRMKCHPVQAKD